MRLFLLDARKRGEIHESTESYNNLAQVFRLRSRLREKNDAANAARTFRGVTDGSASWLGKNWKMMHNRVNDYYEV